MKKLTLFCTLTLIFTGLAMADGAQVHGWGRGIFLPALGTSDGISQAMGTSWGPDVRVGMEVAGSSSDLGFQMKIIGDNATIAGDGVAKIWAKPTSWALLEIGNFTNDTLNGGSEFGSATWLRLVDSPGTFTAIGTDPAASWKGAKNAALSVTPVPGLFAFVDLKKFSYTEESLKQLQYGAGYELKGLAHIRAQIFSNEAGTGATATNKGYANAAVKILAVPGLHADLGLFYPFNATDSGYSLQLVAYANYALDKAKVHALVNYRANKAGDPTQEAGLGLDYDLGGGLSLASDFRYQNSAAKGNTDGLLGGMVGLSKALGGGVIGIGVEVSTTTFLSGTPGATFKAPAIDDPEKLHFAIPVKLEYYF